MSNYYNITKIIYFERDNARFQSLNKERNYTYFNAQYEQIQNFYYNYCLE